jgi:hypothetical protein
VTADNRSPLLQLSLYRDQPGALVSFEAMGRAATSFGALLNRLTLEQSGAKPAVQWVVQRVDIGSLHFEADTIDLVEDRSFANKVREDVASATANGLSRIELGEEPEEVFSPEVAELADVFLSLLQGDLAEMVIRNYQRETRLTPEGAGRHEPRLESRRTSIGSVEGVVKAISLSNQPYFTVYRPTGGPGVRCYFESRELERVKNALLERVMVSGRLFRREDGMPYALRQISIFRVLGKPGELPQVDDLLGIEPNLTEGSASEDWLEARRRGE